MSALPYVGARVMCPFINRMGVVEKIDRSGWAHVRVAPGWVHQLPADELHVMPDHSKPTFVERFMLWASGVFAVLALMLFFAVPAMAGDSLEPGSQATYTDAAGGTWTVHIASIANGVDATPWAWATIDADPRRVIHVPVAELRE